MFSEDNFDINQKNGEKNKETKTYKVNKIQGIKEKKDLESILYNRRNI
jgi:hypothetical protein